MVVAIIPFVCAVVGVLLYALATNPKLAEIGRIMFAMSWLVVMWTVAQRTIHF